MLYARARKCSTITQWVLAVANGLILCKCSAGIRSSLSRIDGHQRTRLPKEEIAKEATVVDAVINAEVFGSERAVLRALPRFRAAVIMEFDTIARLETHVVCQRTFGRNVGG